MGTEYSEALSLELARKLSADAQSFFSISVVFAGISIWITFPIVGDSSISK